MSEDEAIALKIQQLYALLGETYFTTNRATCESDDSKCLLSNILKSEWYTSIFGNTTISQYPNPNPDGYYTNGNACFAFAAFATWYIFKDDNSSSVRLNQIGTMPYEYADMRANARIGDYLRFSWGHSAIVISVESDGVVVLDSNYTDGGTYPHNLVREHKIYYTTYGNDNVLLTRAFNHTNAISDSPAQILDPIYLTLQKGQSFDFSLGQSAASSISGCSWYSSNESIVTVSNGKVTAVSTGCATVKVRNASGGYDECVFYVVDAESNSFEKWKVGSEDIIPYSSANFESDFANKWDVDCFYVVKAEDTIDIVCKTKNELNEEWGFGFGKNNYLGQPICGWFCLSKYASDPVSYIPEPPTINVSKEKLSSGILIISWSAIGKATDYSVYVNGELVETTSKCSAEVTVPTNSKAEIAVKAINNNFPYSNLYTCASQPTSEEVDTSVSIEKLSLLETSTKAVVTNMISLSPIVFPAYADQSNLIWISSDDQVATVRDGVVEALKPGKVIITVYDKNDPNLDLTESTQNTVSGYQKYGTAYQYGEWSEWLKEKPQEQSNLDIEEMVISEPVYKTEYRYWRYTGPLNTLGANYVGNSAGTVWYHFSKSFAERFYSSVDTTSVPYASSGWVSTAVSPVSGGQVYDGEEWNIYLYNGVKYACVETREVLIDSNEHTLYRYRTKTPINLFYREKNAQSEDLLKAFCEITILDSATIHGSITTLNSEDDVRISLLQDGKTVYSAFVKGNTYSILNVSLGEYILEVSQDNCYTSSYSVTVENWEEEQNISLQIKEMSLSDKPGSVYDLSGKLKPKYSLSDHIIWISSDDAIATVENGEIHFISPGTANIYAVGANCDEVEIKTAEADTLQGWTKFDFYTEYGDWSNWSLEKPTENDSVEIDEDLFEKPVYKTQYRYWRYVGRLNMDGAQRVGRAEGTLWYHFSEKYANRYYYPSSIDTTSVDYASSEWTDQCISPTDGGQVFEGEDWNLYEYKGVKYAHVETRQVQVGTETVKQYRCRTKTVKNQFYRVTDSLDENAESVAVCRVTVFGEFENPTYSWDGARCTAKRVCAYDESKQESETVTGEYVKDTDAACEVNEKGHYEATFENPAFEKQSTAPNSVEKPNSALQHEFTNYVSDNNATCTEDGTKTAKCNHAGCTKTDTVTDEGSKLGHKYGKVEYKWVGDQCTATRVCEHDASHVDAETVTGKYVKDTDATCAENEKGHYEATFAKEAFESRQTGKDSVEKPESKLPHTFTETVDDEYLISEATTDSPAVYCKSCSVCHCKSEETFTYGKKLAPAASKPTLKEKTDTTVTLTATTGYEYRCNEGEWQTSNVFTGLTPNTEYKFCQRSAETDDTYAGEASEALSVTTEKSGVKVSGAVTSFGDKATATTVKLYDSTGALVDTTNTTNGTYAFEAVADGTYTVEVSKANHVTRTYEVTVDGAEVKQDVKIHLLGDINGDGIVNITDVNKANAHATRAKLLTGYEFACADVTGEGNVNITDVNKINAHACRSKYLW